MSIPNLVTASQARAYLGSTIPPGTTDSALQFAISSASQLIQRYLGRYVPTQNYTAIKVPFQAQQDKPDPEIIDLDFFPIAKTTLNPRPRCRTSRTQILLIAQNDNATNQEAYIYFNVLGDPEFGLQTNVGITLVSIASGVTTSVSFPFFGTPTSTGFSVAASGSTGSLTAGTYRCAYSNVNEAGESIRSADVTVSVSAGQSLVFTLPPLIAQAESYNVYVSTANGASSTETKQNPLAIIGSSTHSTTYTVSTLIAGDAYETTTTGTVQQLANAINTYGNGWLATPQTGGTGPNNFLLWPSYDLFGSEATMGALTPECTILTGFITDLSRVRFDVASGTVFIAQGSLWNGGIVGQLYLFPGSADFTVNNSSWRPEVLVQYAAGWDIVPEPIAHAALVVTKVMLQELATVTRFQDETADKWKYSLAKIDEKAIPLQMRRQLAEYRVYRS